MSRRAVVGDLRAVADRDDHDDQDALFQAAQEAVIADPVAREAVLGAAQRLPKLSRVRRAVYAGIKVGD